MLTTSASCGDRPLHAGDDPRSLAGRCSRGPCRPAARRPGATPVRDASAAPSPAMVEATWVPWPCASGDALAGEVLRSDHLVGEVGVLGVVPGVQDGDLGARAVVPDGPRPAGRRSARRRSPGPGRRRIPRPSRPATPSRRCRRARLRAPTSRPKVASRSSLPTVTAVASIDSSSASTSSSPRRGRAAAPPSTMSGSVSLCSSSYPCSTRPVTLNSSRSRTSAASAASASSGMT